MVNIKLGYSFADGRCADPLLQPPAAKCVGAGPRVLLGQPAGEQGDGGRGDQGGADQAHQEDFGFDYARISTKSKSPKEHCGQPTSEV